MNLTNIFTKINSYLKEVRIEVKKVNWPTREETMKYTLIVIGFMVIMAILLGGFDRGFVALLTYLIRIF